MNRLNKKSILNTSYLRQLFINSNEKFKLGFIGLIVGISSSLAAVGLNYGLHHLHRLTTSHGSVLLTILLPAIGLVLTVLFLKYLVKDFEGHGVPEVIHSISLKGGLLRLRSAYSKLIGSLTTTGASGPAEPPKEMVIRLPISLE